MGHAPNPACHNRFGGIPTKILLVAQDSLCNQPCRKRHG